MAAFIYRSLSGNGQSFCSGCLSKGSGSGSLCWTSMLTEVSYLSGNRIGTYCSSCLHEIKKIFDPDLLIASNMDWSETR